MKVFSCWVGDRVGALGVQLSQDECEVEDVHGELYARCANGRFLERVEREHGWHTSKSDCLRAAADKVSGMARALLAQAERLREEADRAEG